MNIQPLHDRVIVKRVEEEQTTKGGIIIPDTAKEKPQEGIITAVNPRKASLLLWEVEGSRGREKRRHPWRSRKGTGSCFLNTPAPRSPSMVKNTSS